MKAVLVGATLVLLGAAAVGAWLFVTSQPDTPRGAGAVGPTVQPYVPPDPPLPRVDLCGPTGHTQGHLAELAARGGMPSLAQWFAETVSVPADVRICDRIDGDRTYRGVPWVLLQTLDAKGRPVGVLAEHGAQPASGTGHHSLSKNVFPKDGEDFAPFGLVLYYRDVVPTP